ncbi:hypothetical protein D9M70_604590 [compost metagenome]
MLPRMLKAIEPRFQSSSVTEKRSFREVPRAVNVPSTAAVAGPVCFTFVERKVTVL